MSKHPSSDILNTENLPATSEITSKLETTKEAIMEEASKKPYLSQERKLGFETAELVETTKEFIEEKNKGEIVQKMVKDAALAVDELTRMFQTGAFFNTRKEYITMKLKAQDYGKFAQDNLEALKNLALTLINSGEFRGLIVDFIDLVEQTYRMETCTAPSLKPEKESYQPLMEEAKEKAGQVQEFGKQVVQDIKEGTLPVPEEKKQELKFRFKNILRTFGNDPNYRYAIDGIFSLMDQVYFYGYELKEKAKEQTRPVFYDQNSAIVRFFDDLKLFLSGFAGKESLEKFNHDAYDFLQIVMNNENLSNFFWDFRQFTIQILSNPAFLDEADFNWKWNDLYERGRVLLNDPIINTQWNQVWFDLRFCLENIKNDTLQMKLAEDASKLAKDLFLDTTGKPSLVVMSTGLNNMRKLVLPILKKHLENVSIGGISGSNSSYDWNIDGLYLNAKEIVPDNIEMKVWGKTIVSLGERPSQSLTYLTMWIRDMQLEAKDLKFYFNRKIIPKMEERGICDVHIKGSNELKITWRIEGEQDLPWKFCIEQIRCSLDNLDIYIKESTHTWLMKFITTLFSGSMKRNLEDVVEKNVHEGLGTINDRLNDTLKGAM